MFLWYSQYSIILQLGLPHSEVWPERSGSTGSPLFGYLWVVVRFPWPSLTPRKADRSTYQGAKKTAPRATTRATWNYNEQSWKALLVDEYRGLIAQIYWGLSSCIPGNSDRPTTIVTISRKFQRVFFTLFTANDIPSGKLLHNYGKIHHFIAG